MKEKFTAEMGLEIQAAHLKEWEPKLSAQCYNALAKHLADTTEFVRIKLWPNWTGHDIPRGDDLLTFVANWEAK